VTAETAAAVEATRGKYLKKALSRSWGRLVVPSTTTGASPCRPSHSARTLPSRDWWADESDDPRLPNRVSSEGSEGVCVCVCVCMLYAC